MQTENNSSAEAINFVPLARITPSQTNPRRDFPQDGIESLADSIRQHGVLQPILLRPTAEHTDGKPAYEIVAGERRFRGAKLAEQPSIPARIVEMSDDEVLQVQIIENLQREDVHPLDEARGFLHLKEATQLDLADIAQRIAKDVRYVARRLALTNLIEEAQTDFRQERITLAHALEICRLSPEIQTPALAACYERKHVWNGREQTHTQVPDKEKPARHVRYLQDWIQQNVHLNLHKAPFKMDDTRLREDGLTCLLCPQRTGFNVGLFADVKNNDTCLNPACFRTKLQTFVQITKTELDVKANAPTPYISTYYSRDTRAQFEDVLTQPQYQLLEKKVDRCEYAERAIYVDGAEVGHVRWICREKTCKDHLGRYYIGSTSNGSSSASNTSTRGTVESRSKRKQELFDIRVDEIARKRVMSEALKTYKFPFERTHLNEVAKEFFRRIPSDDQRTILEVLDWDEKEVRDLRMNADKVLARLAKLDNKQLAQFLMLCSFAHFGANQYKHTQVN
ncbi:MAG: ParB/RepB/Spo0J family partition protein [Pyrinomonadaceae bacterium]|nr:ParB/RepB/Spo0J family partition protein [Pyrinomonadaceae bacterium]